MADAEAWHVGAGGQPPLRDGLPAVAEPNKTLWETQFDSLNPAQQEAYARGLRVSVKSNKLFRTLPDGQDTPLVMMSKSTREYRTRRSVVYTVMQSRNPGPYVPEAPSFI